MDFGDDELVEEMLKSLGELKKIEKYENYIFKSDNTPHAKFQDVYELKSNDGISNSVSPEPMKETIYTEKKKEKREKIKKQETKPVVNLKKTYNIIFPKIEKKLKKSINKMLPSITVCKEIKSKKDIFVIEKASQENLFHLLALAKGLFFVRTQWIEDSLLSNKINHWDQYLLEEFGSKKTQFGVKRTFLRNTNVFINCLENKELVSKIVKQCGSKVSKIEKHADLVIGNDIGNVGLNWLSDCIIENKYLGCIQYIIR